jgi:hypothetical protein
MIIYNLLDGGPNHSGPLLEPLSLYGVVPGYQSSSILHI